MSVRDDLQAARDHLAQVGLFKGDYFANYDDPNKYMTQPCCTIGATFTVTYDRDRRAEMAAALTGVVGKQIASWNDDPDRTLDDVLTAFDEAIAGVS